jgi:hypothetical protein
MPTFKVQYSFTCSKCMREKGHVVTVEAEDKILARELAVQSAACPDCHTPRGDQFVATKITELKD